MYTGLRGPEMNRTKVPSGCSINSESENISCTDYSCFGGDTKF